jgi:hypothetical protein
MWNILLAWLCLGWIACTSPMPDLPELLPGDQAILIDSEYDYQAAAEFLQVAKFVPVQASVKSVHRLTVEALGPTCGVVFHGDITHLENGRRRSRVWELHWNDGTWEPQSTGPEWSDDHWAPYTIPDGSRTIEITVNIDPDVPEEAGVELARGMLDGWILPRQEWRRGPPVWIRVSLADNPANTKPRAEFTPGSPVLLRASAGWGGYGKRFQCYRNGGGVWIVLSSGNWMI